LLSCGSGLASDEERALAIDADLQAAIVNRLAPQVGGLCGDTGQCR
jgi:hypothetical protein